jgi:hypothetical protein
MKASSSILGIKAVIAFVFGLLLLLVPGPLLAIFGIQLDASGLMMTRLVGALDIGVGMMAGYARDAVDSPLGLGVVLSLLVQDVIGAIVLLIEEINRVGNAYGWVIFAVNVLFALAFIYIRFFEYRHMEHAPSPGRA